MALARWCHAGQASSPARLTLAWPGTTCPHPVECTGQPGFTASAHPDVSSVVPVVRRAVATVGSGQASGLHGRGTGGSPPRITRYSHCWWLAGRCRTCWLVVRFHSSLGLVQVGRGVVAVRSVLHSPGVARPWWRHSPVGLGRCRSDHPTFFWPRWWLGRVACLYLPDTPQLCGP